MLGTLTNVAVGSGLKIIGQLLGLKAEYKHQKQMFRLADSQAKTDRLVQLFGGNDTADDFTKWTRRLIAWMFTFTVCFVLTSASLHVEWNEIVTYKRESGGIVGYFFTGRSVESRSVATEVMFLCLNLFEIMVGFYFTRVGKKS